MIRLYRFATPAKLSPALVSVLTDEFTRTQRAVWNREDIKTTLSDVGHSKCAYCEARLGRESMYMEVEHFRHKLKYPCDVLNWTNLLPACRRCNGTKGPHDVGLEPIINPFVDDPKSHLLIKRYRLRGKTDLGQKTIEVLDLNNHRRAVLARFEVGEATTALIDECCEQLHNFLLTHKPVHRTKLLSRTTALLEECTPPAAYAATSATVVINSKEFRNLVDALRYNDIWSDQLEFLYSTARDLALDEE